jgi:hypothetical protein
VNPHDGLELSSAVLVDALNVSSAGVVELETYVHDDPNEPTPALVLELGEYVFVQYTVDGLIVRVGPMQVPE